VLLGNAFLVLAGKGEGGDATGAVLAQEQSTESFDGTSVAGTLALALAAVRAIVLLAESGRPR
jgi:hypothetical protein